MHLTLMPVIPQSGDAAPGVYAISYVGTIITLRSTPHLVMNESALSLSLAPERPRRLPRQMCRSPCPTQYIAAQVMGVVAIEERASSEGA